MAPVHVADRTLYEENVRETGAQGAGCQGKSENRFGRERQTVLILISIDFAFRCCN